MKSRLLTLAAFLVLAATGAHGQIQKGDHCVSLSVLLASKGQDVFVDGKPVSTPPSSVNAGFSAGISYFLTDNIAIGCGVVMPYNSTPVGQRVNGDYCYSKSYGIGIYPELRDYLHLTDRLYWMVSLGAGLGMGRYSEDLVGGGQVNTDYTNWEVTVSPIGLEYRVTEKLSLSLAVGYFGYTSMKFTDSGVTYKTNTTLWQLNSSTLSVSFKL